MAIEYGLLFRHGTEHWSSSFRYTPPIVVVPDEEDEEEPEVTCLASGV